MSIPDRQQHEVERRLRVAGPPGAATAPHEGIHIQTGQARGKINGACRPPRAAGSSAGVCMGDEQAGRHRRESPVTAIATERWRRRRSHWCRPRALASGTGCFAPTYWPMRMVAASRHGEGRADQEETYITMLAFEVAGQQAASPRKRPGPQMEFTEPLSDCSTFGKQDRQRENFETARPGSSPSVRGALHLGFARSGPVGDDTDTTGSQQHPARPLPARRLQRQPEAAPPPR